MWMPGLAVKRIWSSRLGPVAQTHYADLLTQNLRYYEQHDFEPVGNFEMRRGNGTIWPGTLLCMELC